MAQCSAPSFASKERLQRHDSVNLQAESVEVCVWQCCCLHDCNTLHSDWFHNL